MDKILFQGMEFYAYHGVFPEENKLGQTYYIDLEVYLDLQKAGNSDNLEDTINYAEIYDLVKNIVTGQQFQLVEKLAEVIAQQILRLYPQVQKLRVRVTKPNPPIPGHYDAVAVEIERGRG